MRETIIRIRVVNGQIGFRIAKNYEDEPVFNLQLASILELIKKSELDKVGELQKKEDGRD